MWKFREKDNNCHNEIMNVKMRKFIRCHFYPSTTETAINFFSYKNYVYQARGNDYDEDDDGGRKIMISVRN